MAGKPTSSCALGNSIQVYPRVGGETGKKFSQTDMAEGLSRVGGETPCRFQKPRQHTGLSPRGRGNQIEGTVLTHRVRSIPAWAGKPAGVGCRTARTGVYPRVGGETGVVEVLP